MDQRNSLLSPAVSYRFSKNNLHVRLEGSFEIPQADELIRLLYQNHDHCQRIFIDVRKVTQPHLTATQKLKAALQHSPIAEERVYFKGKRGFDLATTGNRVLLMNSRKHVCTGNCAHCRCKRQKNAA